MHISPLMHPSAVTGLTNLTCGYPQLGLEGQRSHGSVSKGRALDCPVAVLDSTSGDGTDGCG